MVVTAFPFSFADLRCDFEVENQKQMFVTQEIGVMRVQCQLLRGGEVGRGGIVA